MKQKYKKGTPPVPVDVNFRRDLWNPEPWDALLPSPGFITDLVTTTRLIESPTKFIVWSALFILSTIMKRDTWFRWHPGGLYLNLYIWLVAPPRICAKSTAVGIAERAADMISELLENQHTASKKKLNIHRSKSTPEFLYDLLEPQKYGDSLESHLALVLSELTVFLGQKQYMLGMIDLLTTLYDSREKDEEGTRGRGKHVFKNIYVTMFGATTPDHIASSLPEEAFGGGFMSRVLMIYQATSTRNFPVPHELPGAPTVEELAQRLAWIAENAIGEYHLSSEAFDAYNDWYYPFKESLETDQNKVEKARMDTNLLKLATLIRVQRYEPGNEVSIEDFLTAKNLLNDAYQSGEDLLSDVGTPEFYQTLSKVQKFLTTQGPQTRGRVLREFQKQGMTVELLDNITRHLLQTGVLTLNHTPGLMVSSGERKEILSIDDPKTPFNQKWLQEREAKEQLKYETERDI